MGKTTYQLVQDFFQTKMFSYTSDMFLQSWTVAPSSSKGHGCERILLSQVLCLRQFTGTPIRSNLVINGYSNVYIYIRKICISYIYIHLHMYLHVYIYIYVCFSQISRTIEIEHIPICFPYFPICSGKPTCGAQNKTHIPIYTVFYSSIFMGHLGRMKTNPRVWTLCPASSNLMMQGKYENNRYENHR